MSMSECVAGPTSASSSNKPAELRLRTRLVSLQGGRKPRGSSASGYKPRYPRPLSNRASSSSTRCRWELTPVVEGLLPVVRRVDDETKAVVVLVEQHAHLALEIADEAIVLAHGETVLSGSARELADDLNELETA
jgi:hypothetical protein